jgi:hypothetical protein
MALYFGASKQVKLNIAGSTGKLHITLSPPIVTESIKLLSSDNYILKDINGLFLIPKEAK